MLKGAKVQQHQMAGCLGKLIGSCIGLFYSTEALFKQHASFTKSLFSSALYLTFAHSYMV